MEWESALSARSLLGPPPVSAPSQPFQLGMFRFSELREPFTCPAVDHHYVSFTVNGSLMVERELGEGIQRGQLRSGSSVIMSAGQVNTWTWDRPTDELHLWIRPAYLTDIALEAGLPAPTLIDRFPFADEALRLMTLAVFTELRRPGRAPSLFDDVAGQCMAMQLINHHCTVRVPMMAEPTLTPRQLRRVTSMICSQLDRDLSLSDLANEAGLSRSHFSRAFRRATGVPPYRWLTERRVERAKQLLHSSSLTAAEVGREVGYPSASHFGAVFTRHVGVTPGAYRRSTQV